ncbi:MAG: hypothetical protein IJA27_04225 [Lachnospiraceae bacterium]|nr:hypothetical protein [Lachnospiraceae bacterium]
MNQDEKKAQFHEALAFLVESANINSGVLTTDEIKSALDGLIDDESMFTLVYDYLAENKITIQGYLPYSKNKTDASDNIINADDTITIKTSDTTQAMADSDADNSYAQNSDAETDISENDSKEQHIVDMYLSDINNASSLSETEEVSLLKQYASDHMNREIINSLTESNLKLVLSVAEEFKNYGVSYGDLLQEGNLGLMEGIMTYRGNSSIPEFHEHLINAIQNTMEDAIQEQNASSRIGAHAADRANELDRASVALGKELDRTPTLEELAKYLSLPEDEIERIMKMSLDALTIDNSVEEEN